MHLARPSLTVLPLLALAAACGGGGGGDSAPRPSIVYEFVNPDPGGRDYGIGSTYADLDGDGVADLAVVAPGNAHAPDGEPGSAEHGMVYLYRGRADGGFSDPPMVIPAFDMGMKANPSLSTRPPPPPNALAVDLDGSGINDLVIPAPYIGAVFVAFDPLSATPDFVGPIHIPDGPKATPSWTSMVINNQGLPSKGRKNTSKANNNPPRKGSAATPQPCVIGMPDALDGRGQVAILRGSRDHGSIASMLMGPFSAPGLPQDAGFGSSLALLPAAETDAFEIYVGAPGAGAGGQVFSGMKFFGNCGIDPRNPNCPPFGTWNVMDAPAELGADAEFGASMCPWWDAEGTEHVAIGAPNASDVVTPNVTGAVVLASREYPPRFVIINTNPPPKICFRLGAHVEVGDPDGDGHDDLIVSVPNRLPDGSGRVEDGEIYVATDVSPAGAASPSFDWVLVAKATPGADVTLGHVQCPDGVFCNAIPVNERINWDIRGHLGYEEGMVLVRDVTDGGRLGLVLPASR